MAPQPLALAFPAWGFALVGVRESKCRRWVLNLVLPDDFGHFSFHAESPRSSAISTGGFRCLVSIDEQPMLDVWSDSEGRGSQLGASDGFTG